MPARLGLLDLQTTAKAKGGTCLSRSYVNKRSKMRWRCAEGHEWDATVNEVRYYGTWCPYCAGKAKHTLAEMQALAHSRGGECLSQQYTNVGAKLRWKCRKGHEWDATPNQLLSQGTWCSVCAGNARKTLQEIRILAREHGGECLSQEYGRNNKEKLRWRCGRGHEWEAAPFSIASGHWCPNCRSKSEQQCRDILEELTKATFPKKRPPWLEGLELDGFCEELGLAFEYQGKQHDTVVSHWHPDGEASLNAQKARDTKKARLCDDKWVTVIVIWHHCVDKRAFIEKELDLLGYLA